MTRRTTRLALAVVAALALALAVAACNTQYGASIDRPEDPVVLQGSALPKLEGTAPSHIVAGAWDGKQWHQIPVQVDERDLVSPGQIYNWPQASWPTLFGTTTPYKILVYTPPAQSQPGYTSTSTYTPPDSDPNLDANDEVSFLASDAGQLASASDVAQLSAIVDTNSEEQVKATDPLPGGGVGYVYLFHSDGLQNTTGPNDGVHYTFDLLSGDYKATYQMGTMSNPPNNSWGFNPEQSTVDTPFYSQSFGDRWLNNGMTDKAGTSPSTNLLDRSKYYATLPGCIRTENTFDGGDAGEGAFIVNISGPVRAIRSYLGANSYSFTASTDIFYPQREDSVIELRGHTGIPGYGLADDYATGLPLRYSDPSNTNIAVDGNPDSVKSITWSSGQPIPPTWQMIQGPTGSMAQGSVVTVRTLDTDIANLQATTVYQDQSPASPAPCTGDGSYWGQNGTEITSTTGSVPATDPTLTATPGHFTMYRFRFFEGPGYSTAAAANLDARAKNPIQVSVSG